MPRLTGKALAATGEALTETMGLARSLLAEALGLSPATLLPEPARANDRRRRWGPQTIVQAVEAFVAREGRLPCHPEWKHARRWGLPALDTVRRYWGSCAELHQTVMRRRRLITVLTAITPGENDAHA